MKRLFLAGISCIFLCSCVILKPSENKLLTANKNYWDRINYEQGRYFGFDLEKSKLKNPKWFYVINQQRPNHAIFRLPKASPTHTFYGEASIYNLPKGTDTLKQLQQLLKKSFISKTGHAELISADYKIVKYKGVECIKYSTKAIDKKPNNSSKPLIMTFEGYICFHPQIKDMTLDYFYSERGTEKEINKNIYHKDGEDFFNAVIIK